MKKIGVMLVVIIFILALPLSVGATGESGGRTHLYDLGSFLTTTEEGKLNGRLGALSNQYGLDLIFVIVDDLDGKESSQYALDFYDEKGHGEEGSIFLVDMENRQLELWSFGKFGVYMESYFQGAIDTTKEAMQTSGQNIYAAADSYIRYMSNNLSGWPAFLNSSHETLQYDPETDYYEYKYKNTPKFTTILATSFLGGIIASIVIVGIMFFVHSRTLPGGISGRAYATNGLALKGRSDRFVHTFTSRTRRNDNNSSGGGGGGSMTRTSSGGRSARGGGGSF